MTTSNTVKSQVRKRMRKTGESYSTALRHISDDRNNEPENFNERFDSLTGFIWEMIIAEGEMEYEAKLLIHDGEGEIDDNLLELLAVAGIQSPILLPDVEFDYENIVDIPLASLLEEWLKSCTHHNDYFCAVFQDTPGVRQLREDIFDARLFESYHSLKELIPALALSKISQGNQQLLSNFKSYRKNIQGQAKEFVERLMQCVDAHGVEFGTDPLLFVNGSADDVFSVAEREGLVNRLGADRSRVDGIYDYLDGKSVDPEVAMEMGSAMAEYISLLSNSRKKNKDDFYVGFYEFMSQTVARKKYFEQVKKNVFGFTASKMGIDYNDVFTELYNNERHHPLIVRIMCEEIMVEDKGKGRQFCSAYFDSLEESEYFDGLLDDLKNMKGVEVSVMKVCGVNVSTGTMDVQVLGTDSEITALSVYAGAAEIGDVVSTRLFKGIDDSEFSYTSEVVINLKPEEMKVVSDFGITALDYWLMRTHTMSAVFGEN